VLDLQHDRGVAVVANAHAFAEIVGGGHGKN
jgi:hypothetical protein